MYILRHSAYAMIITFYSYFLLEALLPTIASAYDSSNLGYPIPWLPLALAIMAFPLIRWIAAPSPMTTSRAVSPSNRLFKSRFVLKCVLTQLIVFAFIAVRSDLSHMFRHHVKNSRSETSIFGFRQNGLLDLPSLYFVSAFFPYHVCSILQGGQDKSAPS